MKSDLDYSNERINVQDNGCWHWTGAIDRKGYGRATRIVNFESWKSVQ